MNITQQLLPIVALSFCGGCTDDPRLSASREQIEGGLFECGITNAEIADGIDDVTTAFVVNFNSETGAEARACFSEKMQNLNVLQTTAWSGSQNAQTH